MAAKNSSFSKATLLIWDDIGEAPNNESDVLHWQQDVKIRAENTESIVELVEQNSEKIRSRYLSWVYELGILLVDDKSVKDILSISPGFSYWWASSIAQKFNYSGTSQINDALKLLALGDYLILKKYKNIVLKSRNKNLASSIAEYCERKEIGFKFKKNRITKEQIFSHVKPIQNLLMAVLTLLRHELKVSKLRIKKSNHSNLVGEIMFIDVLVHLGKNSADSGKFNSNYWTLLVDKLNEWNLGASWLHLYFKHPTITSIKKATKVLDQFNSSSNQGQHHILLDQPLSIQEIFSTVKNFYKISTSFSKVNQALSIGLPKYDVDLWPLHHEDFRRSLCGSQAMDFCVKFSLFHKIFKDIPHQRLGIYIAENQPWEMALLHAWKFYGHGKLIGVAHTTIRYWDLRYFYDSRSYSHVDDNKLPMPDILAVNGPVAQRAIISSGYPAHRVEGVEALRFIHLRKQTTRHYSKKRDYLKVLICGDFKAETSKQMLDWLNTASACLPKSTKYIFKPHPAYPFTVKKGLNFSLETNENQLDDLFIDCDIVFTSNITSAAVDAYCSGIPLIQMLSRGEFNTSPLRGLKNTVFVKNQSELALALCAIEPGSYNNSEDYFYLNPELKCWKKLLGTVL